MALPSDIFRVVVTHLDPEDLLIVRLVCRELYDLSKSRSVWNALLKRLVLDEDIPIPGLRGRPLDSLSAQELEEVIHRARGLRKKWLSEAPVIRRSANLAGIPGTRIVALHLLAGRGRQWLISLSMTSGQGRVFTIRCWDLQAPTAVCIARREFTRFGGMAVNKIATDNAHIAILTPNGLEILALNLSTTDSSQGFMVSSTIQTRMSSIHYLHGSRLVAGDNNGRLYLLLLDNPQIKIEFQHNIPAQIALLDFVMTETFMMVLNAKSLELYALPTCIRPGITHIVRFPIFEFQWPWRIDYGVMTLRHRTNIKTPRNNDPITIFIRFGSLYPWPVNLLHRYEITPNPYFATSELPSEMNIPYEYPPVLYETIASPVRLHATSDLVIGPYGTAIWTDSHTEGYYHHANCGQRVAGSYARPSGSHDDEDAEVEPPDQVPTSAASSVYAHHEEDSWVRLALDEMEGRILAGRDDGVIEIFEYA